MINPWTQGRVQGVRPFPPLGAWMSRRKLASAPFVPPQWARIALEGTHLYFYNFPQFQLLAAQTLLGRITVTEDFWMLAVLAQSTSALAGTQGTFRGLVYEDKSDVDISVPAYKYSKYAVNQLNLASKASEPGFLFYPHFIPKGTPVNARIQNLDGANPNNVDICLFGYSSWWRP